MPTVGRVSEPFLPGWELRGVRLDHPDAVRLVAEVQQEYAVRYGTPDQAPISGEQFDPPDGCFVVGYLDGVPVATGAWRRTTVALAGARDVVEIKRMYVAPRARRRGLARRVLAHLEDSARQAGADGVVLETGTLQPEAIAMYAAAGYAAVPGFGHYRESPLSRCFGKVLRKTGQK